MDQQRTATIPQRSADEVAAAPFPTSLTTLVGREAEIGRVAALLDRGDIRLVTLTGPGGVGKTRLALAVAERIANDFADGTRFVDLAGLRDAAQVPAQVARTLGVVPRDGADPVERINRLLADRHLLLVVDNFEHLLGDAPLWLPQVLQASPRVRILITSRVPLNIASEQQFAVEPLPVAAADGDAAATRLFLDRARQADPQFSPDAAACEAIAAICGRLDGLPLAIELAAARIAVLDPADILRRLDGSMALLTSHRRDAPERHRSLQQAIAWSYDLLSRNARWLYRQLSVFVDGIPLDAVEFLVARRGQPDADLASLHWLQELLDHGLLRQVRTDGGETRYRMLETIREFGLEQLASAGEVDSAGEAHAAWAARLGRKGADQGAYYMDTYWIDRFEIEHANLRRATTWLMEQDRVEDAVSLTRDLCQFRALRGYATETLNIHEEALRHPRLQEPSLVRAKALNGTATVLHLREDRARARAMITEAVELYHRFGDIEAEAWCHGILGFIHAADDELDMAENAFSRFLEVAKQAGQPSCIAAALSNLARAAYRQGDVERAVALDHDALRLSRSMGNLWVEAYVLVHLAQIAIDQGDDARAEMLLAQSRTACEQLDNKLDLPKVEQAQAHLELRRGDPQAAHASLERAVKAARAIGESDFVARLQVELAHTAAVSGRQQEAGTYAAEALRYFHSTEQPVRIAECLTLLAMTVHSLGDAEDATTVLSGAEGAVAGYDDVRWLALTEDERATIRTRLGRGAGRSNGKQSGRQPDDGALERAVETALAWIDRIERAGVAARGETLAERAGLSARELEVLRLLADGLTNREIAEALFVSERTVGSHIDHILTKLGARSRTAAVAVAIRSGLA